MRLIFFILFKSRNIEHIDTFRPVESDIHVKWANFTMSIDLQSIEMMKVSLSFTYGRRVVDNFSLVQMPCDQ